MKPETDIKKMIRERIWESPEGCWIWIKPLSKEGYGHIRVGGRKGKLRQAHIVSYEAYIGQIPDGWQLDHRCNNRSCVNPMHLKAVSPKENFIRSNHPMAILYRKGVCAKGHTLKITPSGNRYCPVCEKTRAKNRLLNNPEYAKHVRELQKVRYQRWKAKRLLKSQANLSA